MPSRPYEVVYIIDPDVSQEDGQAMVERFRALAEAQGAQGLRVDSQILGKRRLAYQINHKRDGQFIVMNFESEANAPAEVERVLKITDGILRSMVVRLDEMPPEPAAPAPPPAPAAQAPAPVASAPAPTETAPAPEASAEPDAAPAEAAAPALESDAAAEAAPDTAAEGDAEPAPDAEAA